MGMRLPFRLLSMSQALASLAAALGVLRWLGNAHGWRKRMIRKAWL